MPAGVVQTDQYNFPLYESRPLENVSLKKKLICGLLCFFMIACLILGICVYFWLAITTPPSAEKKHPNEALNLICAQLMIGVIILLECILLTILVSTTYTVCCVKQVVDCNVHKGLSTHFRIAFLVISSLPICFALWYGHWISIVMIICAILTVLSAFGNLHCLKKYCQCKTCRGIKDVKLTYGNVTEYVNETQHITSSNLMKWFNILSSNNNHLAIQIGESIMEFYDENAKVRLHAGDYVIREISHHLVPLSICQSPTYKRTYKSAEL